VWFEVKDQVASALGRLQGCREPRLREWLVWRAVSNVADLTAFASATKYPHRKNTNEKWGVWKKNKQLTIC